MTRMSARDLLLAGYCSAQCLLALVPEGTCKCRCGGATHGAAADAEVDADLTAISRIPQDEQIERLLTTMTPAEQRNFVTGRGWNRLGNSYIHPSRPDNFASLAYAIRKEMRDEMAAASAIYRDATVFAGVVGEDA